MRVDGKYAGELYRLLKAVTEVIDGGDLKALVSVTEEDAYNAALELQEEFDRLEQIVLSDARALLVRIEASATPALESQSDGSGCR